MSTEELVGVVRQLIDLLRRSGQSREAVLLDERLTIALTTEDYDWPKFRSDLYRFTMGMGSLSDIYLHPPDGSGLDKEEANLELDRLTDVLHRLTK